MSGVNGRSVASAASEMRCQRSASPYSDKTASAKAPRFGLSDHGVLTVAQA